MDKLEQDNKNLTVSDTDAQHCEAFAMQVFSRADKQDRSGKADHNTVRAFYVATIFIDVSFDEIHQLFLQNHDKYFELRLNKAWGACLSIWVKC